MNTRKKKNQKLGVIALIFAMILNMMPIATVFASDSTENAMTVTLGSKEVDRVDTEKDKDHNLQIDVRNLREDTVVEISGVNKLEKVDKTETFSINKLDKVYSISQLTKAVNLKVSFEKTTNLEVKLFRGKQLIQKKEIKVNVKEPEKKDEKKEVKSDEKNETKKDVTKEETPAEMKDSGEEVEVPEEVFEKAETMNVLPKKAPLILNAIPMARSAGTVSAYIKYRNTYGTSAYDGRQVALFSVRCNGASYTGYCRNPGWPAPAEGTYTFYNIGESKGYTWYAIDPKVTSNIYDIDANDRANIIGGSPWKLQGVVFGIPSTGYARIHKVPVGNAYDPDKHSIAGAWYRVYKNKADARAMNGNVWKSFQTDKNGYTDYISVTPNTDYYVVESKAPEDS